MVILESMVRRKGVGILTNWGKDMELEFGKTLERDDTWLVVVYFEVGKEKRVKFWNVMWYSDENLYVTWMTEREII